MNTKRILLAVLLILLPAGRGFGQAVISGAAEIRLQFSPEQPSISTVQIEARVIADLNAVFTSGAATPLLMGYSVPIGFDPSRVRLVSAAAGDALGLSASGFAATELSVANTRGFVTIVNTRMDPGNPGTQVELARLIFQPVRAGKSVFVTGSVRTIRQGSLSASPTGAEPAQLLNWGGHMYPLQIAAGDTFTSLLCPSWISMPGTFQGMAFLNEGTEEASFQLYGWNRDGTLVQRTSATNPSRPTTLAALHQDARVTEQIFESGSAMNVTGWIEARFTKPDISGLFIQGVNSDTGVAQMDGADMATSASSRIIFPLIGNPADRKPEVSVSNPGDSPVAANFIVMKADGTSSSGGTFSTTIPGHGFASVVFAGSADYLLVDADGGILGVERFGAGQALAVLNGQDPAFASNRLTGPQFATGLLGGSLRINTHIALVNPAEDASQVVFHLVDERGREIASPVTRTAPAKGQISIPGWALFGLEDPATTTQMIVGTLTIESERGLVGALTFGDPVQGTYMASLPLLSTSAAKREIFFGHVAVGLLGGIDYFTGLALVNPSATATAHINLELYTSDGKLVAKTQTPFELGPNSRTAQLVEQLIPDFKGPQSGGFIHLTSDVEVYGYSLFGDRAYNFLSAVPVR